MAYTPKKVFRGALTNVAGTTIFTVPSSVAGLILKGIELCNDTGTAETVTVQLNGFALVGPLSVAAAETKFITLSQVLDPLETIKAWSGTTSGVIKAHISGVTF